MTAAGTATPPGPVSVTVDADTVAGSTASENVAEAVASRAMPVAPSDGLSPLTVGPVVSTAHVRLAAVGSVPPAVVARTSNVCGPSASPVTVNGDVQPAKAPPSIRHPNVAVASGGAASNVNAADVARTVPVGPEPESMAVSGVGAAGPPLRYGSAPIRVKALSDEADVSIVQSRQMSLLS